jgi:two-component system cell cycle sensor histidine kinase/response regulator CckA
VYGIVKQSQGYVQVESESGVGTRFMVYLPRVTPDARPEETARVSPPVATGTPRRARILVVEDEPAVRRLVQRTLAARSHDVVTAAEGREALEVAGGGTPIELLVTDVVMPGMRGIEVAAALRERQPGLPVLYLSGYTEHLQFEQEFPGPRADFLQKPFTAEALVRKVTALLEITA